MTETRLADDPAFAVCRCGHWKSEHTDDGRCTLCQNTEHRYEFYEYRRRHEERNPIVCPWCDHVIDHCRIVTCSKHQVYAIIKQHAPSYWWSPASVEFDGEPEDVQLRLDALVTDGLLKRSSGIVAPLYALKEGKDGGLL